MRLRPIELVASGQLSDGWPKSFRSPGSAIYASSRDRASIPKEWLDAILREGIPPIIFLNQAAISGGDYRKVIEITKRYRLLYEKAVEELKGDPYLYKQARSAIEYYREFESTGELPNRCITPPAWESQQGISDTVIEVFTREYGAVHSGHNSGYDMHTGIRKFGNCLVTCLFYVTIARRLGLKADIYYVPKHALAGIHLKGGVQFVDPSLGKKLVEPAIPEFTFPDGSKEVLDYRKPKKTDTYGLSEAWFNKGSSILEAGAAGDECGETPAKPPSEGKLFEAIEALEACLKIDPNHAEAWTNRGKAFSQLAHYELARGRRDAARSRYSSALKSYLTALRLMPDSPIIWLNKGIVCTDLGRIGDAIAAFDESIRLDRKNAAAWHYRAAAIMGRLKEGTEANRAKALQDALYSYERALELEPKSARAWHAKGGVLYNLGRFEEALSSFDAALSICPKAWKAADYKGNAFYQLNRFEEALEAFERSLRINPKSADMWNNKGAALYNLGRLGESEKAFLKALKLQPKMASAWSNKSELLLGMGRPEEALMDAETATRLEPSLAEAWKNKGNALSALGRKEEAENAYAKAREIS